MLREVLQQLQPDPGLTVLDGTVGAGGHSAEILRRIGPNGRLIGFDRDPMMLQFARHRLSGENVVLFQAPYSEAADRLRQADLLPVDRVLLDLGVSSDQLADRGRGFGFDAGGRLDMRFDTNSGPAAARLLESCSREELVRIFSDYGEEPQAERIADAVLQRRQKTPVTTAEELADLVRGIVRPTRHRDPATRVFQALRIAVNRELEHLERTMTHVLPAILRSSGLVVVITFHSLEDRIVKSAFKGHQGWHVLTKTPLRPSPAEIRINPRSRSAKLRTARWTHP